MEENVTMYILNSVLLILHFVGLTMGLAVPFSNMVMGGIIAKAAPPERAVLGRFPLAMSMVGKIGLTLLWLTGLTLVFTKYGGFGGVPVLFHIKLGLVLVLTILVGMIARLEGRVRRGDMSVLPRIETLGKAAGGTALVIIIFAVLSFQ